MLKRLPLMLFAASAQLASSAPARAQTVATPGIVAAPELVTVRLAYPNPTLVAGEQGTLVVELEASSPAPLLSWAPGAAAVRMRISAPAGSGVTFPGSDPPGADPALGERMVLVPVPERVPTRLRVRVPYQINSRSPANDTTLRLDIEASLLSATGAPLHDGGTVELPIRVETPLATKLVVIGLILVVIFLFIAEWVRIDVIGIMMMVALPILNLIDASETFSGLSSNAVVAMIGVMIVSAGVNKVGLVSRMMGPVILAAGRSPTRLMIVLCSLISLISGVMQNAGAAVLFLPGIRHACKEINTPISRILMPIGMCAILGGTLTMIGSSCLILLNDILPAGMEKFGLLELTPIGALLALAGIIYFATVGRYFLARLGGPTPEEPAQAAHVYHELDGPYELHVPANWSHPGGPRTLSQIRREYLVSVVGIDDESGLQTEAPPPETELSPGFDLAVYGPSPGVERLVEEFGLQLRPKPVQFKRLFNPAVAGTVEAVVTPHSTLIGRSLQEIRFRVTFGATPLAVFQEGRTYYREMSQLPLRAGDAILLHGTWEHLHSLHEIHRNFVYTVPLEVEIQRPEHVKTGVICFAITLAAMALSSFYFQGRGYNPIPLSVCLMAGAVLMVVTRVLNIREAYTAVDWRTIFLMGGLIPFGLVVGRTGTAEWLASGVVHALGDAVTPILLLSVLAVMSALFCLVVSNVGACVLLVPLAVSMAMKIGIDPRVAAVVVGLGVSNSFLLPTHQVNALFMGPGEYRTRDYLKIGGVMSIIFAVVLVAAAQFLYL